MTIKVKMRGDKATIRFGNKMEERFFQNIMINVRDSNPTTHPTISVKDRSNTEIPSMPKPKPIKPTIALDTPIIVKPKPIPETMYPNGVLAVSGPSSSKK